jgi:nicotinamide-nucleotide amidase
MNGPDTTVAELLRTSGLTLAVAESCSGGLLATRITDIAGASAYFLLGTVTYADSAKIRVLSVPAATLAAHGAVSAETAIAMAKGVRLLAGSDLALATTGIAGPGGGTAEKPVGTVFIAVADAAGCSVVRHCFAGDREAVRKATVETALQLLAGRLAPSPRSKGIA